MLAQHIPRMSLAEYLELEERAESRSEFWDGQMLAMAGGSYEHGLIASNIAGELRALLKGSGCKVTGSDVLVQAAPGSYVAYPDVTVHCGEPQFATDAHRVLVNPVLVVEVLSPAAESGRQYLLVETSTPDVELYPRGEDGIWYLREWHGLEAACELESIGCRLPLAQIFDWVAFA